MNGGILHRPAEPNNTKIVSSVFDDRASERPQETWTASEHTFISVLKGMGLESVTLTARIVSRGLPAIIEIAADRKIAVSAINGAVCRDRAFSENPDQSADADFGTVHRHTETHGARLHQSPIFIAADWHPGRMDPGVLAVRSISGGDRLSARRLLPILSAEEIRGAGINPKGFVYLDLDDDPALRLSHVCQCFDAYALWLRTMADWDIGGITLHMFSGHWRRVCFLHTVGNRADGHEGNPLQARVALESKLRTLNRQEILGLATLLDQVAAISEADGSGQLPKLFELHWDEHAATIKLFEPEWRPQP